MSARAVDKLRGMSYEPTDTELKRIASSYVAQWNEPDPAERCRLIRHVWAVDGVQVLVNPPQEIRDAAAHYGIAYPALEVRGYDALAARVGRAYDMFVAGDEYVFELDGEPARQAGAAVALTWVMRSRTDGTVVGSGLDVLTFDTDCRVRTDHQFVA